MKKGILLSLLSALIIGLNPAFAADEIKRLTAGEYISRYKEDAIRDMQKTGVPASITLAQGMYESENGNSRLAREANNHFGIKCHKEWTGPTFIKDDDTKNECFRKYESVLESYDDHSNFLRTRDRYSFLFSYLITDYKNWAYGLKKAGYATNPEYANKLIKIIEENNLNELDFNSKVAYADVNPPAVKAVNSRPPPAITKPETKKPAEFVDNNIKFVVAQKGDSYLSVAQQQGMMLWELLKYNDADNATSIREGEVIYLKPKRNKTTTDFHIMKEGESMRSVSQLYGIKLKQLYRRNHIEVYTEPPPGTTLLLNKTVK